jgi:hypothetical protein
MDCVVPDAVELETGERLSVRPSCLLEDVTEADLSSPPPLAPSTDAATPPSAPPVIGSKGAGVDGSVGHRYNPDYDRFEKLAAQQVPPPGSFLLLQLVVAVGVTLTACDGCRMT